MIHLVRVGSRRSMNKKIWVMFFFTVMMITSLSLSFQTIFASDRAGSFDIAGYNNAPSFNRFIGPSTNGATLTPNQTYTIELDVEDLDGIRDIKSLTFVFYYIADQPETLSGLDTYFDGLSTTSENGTEVLMRWENQGASASGSTEASPDDPDLGFTIVSDGGIASDLTWEIVSSTVPSLSSSEITGDTFNFEVEFRISKVAKEAIQSQWRFGVIVEDGRTITDFDTAQVNDGITKISTLQSDFSPVATDVIISESDRYNMAFYGEVSPPENAELIWPNVLSPGTLFEDEENVSLSGIQFISNSDYLITAKSESFWVATGAAVTTGGIIEITKGSKDLTGAALTAEIFDATTEQKFRLGIDDDGVFSESDFVLLDDTYTFITLEEETATIEGGTLKTYYFYLELSNLFYNADYIGDIIIGISNKPSS